MKLNVHLGVEFPLPDPDDETVVVWLTPTTGGDVVRQAALKWRMLETLGLYALHGSVRQDVPGYREYLNRRVGVLATLSGELTEIRLAGESVPQGARAAVDLLARDANKALGRYQSGEGSSVAVAGILTNVGSREGDPNVLELIADTYWPVPALPGFHSPNPSEA